MKKMIIFGILCFGLALGTGLIVQAQISKTNIELEDDSIDGGSRKCCKDPASEAKTCRSDCSFLHKNCQSVSDCC
jgi:hypothetical protein